MKYLAIIALFTNQISAVHLHTHCYPGGDCGTHHHHHHSHSHSHNGNLKSVLKSLAGDDEVEEPAAKVIKVPVPYPVYGSAPPCAKEKVAEKAADSGDDSGKKAGNAAKKAVEKALEKQEEK